MNNQPLVSLITVCFNAAEVLETTLKSALNQSFQNFELVIIDGGSTDQTLSIAKQFKDKIGYIVSEKDKGIYDAMNKGVKAAKGKWVYFLNAGDAFYSNSVLSDIFDNAIAEDIQLIYGRIETKNEPTGINYTAGKPVTISDFYSGYPICHQATFSQKKLFENIGYFNTKFKLAADTEWFFRVFKKHENHCLYIPNTIAFYDIQGTTYHKRMAGYQEYLNFGKTHFPFLISIKNHLYYPLLWLKVKAIRLFTNTFLFKFYRSFKFRNQQAAK
jgi:glycosyltransferase involved in cell wall biosynthesis